MMEPSEFGWHFSIHDIEDVSLAELSQKPRGPLLHTLMAGEGTME